MDISIEELKKVHAKKTKASIIDAEEMRIIIPVLLREIVSLEKKLSESEKYIAILEAKKPKLTREGESGKAQWKIKYCDKKNRLYIKLKGVFNSKSAKSASNTVIAFLSHTQKQFDVINDISELEAVTDLKVLFHLKKVGFSLKQFGVGRSVRILNEENKIIPKLFEKGLDEFNNIVTNADSLEEAEKLLDNNEKFLKL